MRREIVDWGVPIAPEWGEPRERLHARLPSHLVRVLHVRARSEGVSVSSLVHRLIVAGLGQPGSAVSHPEPVGTTFD